MSRIRLFEVPISFVEATPRYAKGRTARDKLTVRIELTDFSVYYSQGAAEHAIAALKDGKSDVICDRGQLVKVSKSKDGVVTRDTLTKTWTDRVDYWAVDFDYQSRKEIIKVPVDFDLASPSGRGQREAPGEGAAEVNHLGDVEPSSAPSAHLLPEGEGTMLIRSADKTTIGTDLSASKPQPVVVAGAACQQSG